MNKIILEQVLSEQVDQHACENKPFADFFEEVKNCPLFEQMVIASVNTIDKFPLGLHTAIRVCLGYALYSGVAYAKAEREVKQLEELT